VLEEANRVDDQPRAICPDCGNALAAGQIICAQSYGRLSAAEKSVMGRNLRVRP
jgi:hypothetical protein